jgi:leader peptidase (prepilin peptidase)/N-methyltransferase
MFDILRLVLYIIILITIAVIDFKKGIIPNRIVYPAAVAVILLNLISAGTSSIMTLIGGISLAGFFLVSSLLLKNIGMGDIKLALLIGLMAGFPEGIIAIFSGIFIGGLVAIVLVLSKIKGRKDTMPYGPFLAAGAIITLIGHQFSLFGFLYTL